MIAVIARDPVIWNPNPLFLTRSNQFHFSRSPVRLKTPNPTTDYDDPRWTDFELRKISGSTPLKPNIDIKKSIERGKRSP